MSGIQQMMMGGGGVGGTVTAGFDNGGGYANVYGYYRPGWTVFAPNGIGSITPSHFNGFPIGALYNNNYVTPVVAIGFIGDMPNGFFSTLNIGSFSYSAGSATYSQSSGNSTWQWFVSGALPFNSSGQTLSWSIF